jgi:Ca2+-binding EF-hand superfamily protein
VRAAAQTAKLPDMTHTARELQELVEHFAQCDRNRDQRIDFAEFCELLRNLDAGMASDELRVGFELIDRNRNGSISFAEFRDWWLED